MTSSKEQEQEGQLVYSSAVQGQKRQATEEEGRLQEGRKKLVSSQFRKQQLAVWAAGRGPDPSFSAMVFWPCDRVLLPDQCKKASCKSEQASCKLAVGQIYLG